MFPDGAAHKDGRLQPGDQILDMCSQSFKNMEHDQAHAAVLKASGTVRPPFSPLIFHGAVRLLRTMGIHRDDFSFADHDVGASTPIRQR